MSDKVKILHICFPDTEERREMSFHDHDMKAAIIAYHYLLENGAVITKFENFENWEIKLLEESKAPTGEPLVAPKCCCKADPNSEC